jgi:hypothetical protein
MGNSTAVMGATRLEIGQSVGQRKIFAGPLGWVAVFMVIYLNQSAAYYHNENKHAWQEQL